LAWNWGVKKLRIGIYIEPVKVSDKTGISRYIIGLVESLVSLDKDNIYYLYYQTNLLNKEVIDWLNDCPNTRHKPLRFPQKWLSERPRLWWQFYLPFVLYLDKIDVFHGPNHYVPLKGKIPSVVTIHDLAYYYMDVHGEEMDRILKQWTNQAMATATKVVTVSKSTAKDCQKEGVSNNKLSVIYQGYEDADKTTVEKLDFSATHLADKSIPFILFIGTIQPRKNIPCLIQSFAEICQQIPHNLVIAGAPGNDSQLVDELIIRHGLESRVIKLGYISDKQRSALYQHAEVFVYPSKYEGFGLVILEAMSYGVPVITSDNSSLPEAAGGAAILVDANSMSQLAKAMKDVCTDASLRESLAIRGRQQSTQFTWINCATAMLQLYEDTALKTTLRDEPC
jgi:glycosyltransferase involved in cell wall biosynthesis